MIQPHSITGVMSCADKKDMLNKNRKTVKKSLEFAVENSLGIAEKQLRLRCQKPNSPSKLI